MKHDWNNRAFDASMWGKAHEKAYVKAYEKAREESHLQLHEIKRDTRMKATYSALSVLLRTCWCVSICRYQFHEEMMIQKTFVRNFSFHIILWTRNRKTV